MTQQIICIVAGQRSGTTALQAILGSTGKVRNFSEIFHTEEVTRPGSFLGYCRSRNIMLADAMKERDVRELCREFLKHLSDTAAHKHILIDVKFNSWGAIQPAWRYPNQEPFFLNLLKNMNAMFIFVQRQNVAEQILSEQIARAANKWHNLSEIPNGSLEVNVQQAKSQARLICLSETFLWSFLREYKRTLGFIYESMFEDGELSNDARARICEELGQKLVFPARAPIRKNSLDKKKAVTNYNKVVAAVTRAVERKHRPRIS